VSTGRTHHASRQAVPLLDCRDLRAVLPRRRPEPIRTAAPTLHVYSRETIVDVLVTDDKGQPVRGLTRSDFTVEEDGNAQPIRGFREYDKIRRQPRARTPAQHSYQLTALPPMARSRSSYLTGWQPHLP